MTRQRIEVVFPASLGECLPAPAPPTAVLGAQCLTEILAANRAGRAAGVYAVCSAHPVALEAALLQARRDGAPVLIEATANQVNQFGGYTGMRPADFRARVEALARTAGLSPGSIVLGGDHLGPVCWTRETARTAMAKAHELVAAYVAAGFAKIHLDTSMACADDGVRLAEASVARRAAALCRTAERVAEERFGESSLCYVIGTEVPAPGGARGEGTRCEPTAPRAARRTVAMHEAAFRTLGLESAWARVAALVVQPGVEFDNDSVTDYDPGRARPLKDAVADLPGLVYEAHSTDYQRAEALAALVRDHFAILKVGPQLTCAVREALFALSHIEAELIPAAERADLPAVCERAMLDAPGHWRGYCGGRAGRVTRLYGYADRIRYYWTRPAVAAAVETLMKNLATVAIPAPLLAQHLPRQYEAVRAGALKPRPKALVLDQVLRVTARYARACRPPEFPESGVAP